MCVGFWCLDHPEYALILCTNRDEFLSRPTAPAHFHQFEGIAGSETRTNWLNDVISGRDLVAGGTWLGATRTGKVGFLTNITEPYVDLPSSRGHLLQHFLQNSDQTSPTDLLEQWNTQEYAGFNMLLLSLDTAGSSLDYQGTYVTNHGAKGTIVSRPLSNDERHRAGLSNDVDGRDTGQLWPKVSLGIQSLDKVISSHDPTTCTQDQLIENLFKLLQQKSPIPPEDRSQLRNTIMIDPLQLQKTSQEDRYYGTRLATVVLVSRHSRTMTFVERDVWSLNRSGVPVMGKKEFQRRFEFPLDDSTES